MLIGTACALLAAGMYGVAAILQATGARQVEAAETFSPLVLLAMLRRPAFVVSLVLTLAGFLLHLVALRTLPLYLAQSAIAASLAITALLAVTVYGDHLARAEWAAVGAVVAGLALLTAGGGAAGDVAADGAIDLALAVTVAVIVVGGVIAAGSRGGIATAAMGLLAGLGYAVVGISGRLLPDLGPDVLLTPVAWTLAVGGGLGFLLYSQALQRGAVTTVTGLMIAVQTAAPSVVGLLLLGDDVRPGWGWAVLVGFLLAGTGTLVLVRFESAPGAAHDSDQAPGGRAHQGGGRGERDTSAGETLLQQDGA